MPGAVSLHGRSRRADRLPWIVNVAISNVPGPQHPPYFAGAELAGFFPVSIPAHRIALNMTVQSHDSALEIDAMACRRAMPDVTDLADHGVQGSGLLGGLIEALEPAAPAAVAMAAPASPALPAAKAAAPAVRKRARPRLAASQPAAPSPPPMPPISAARRTRRVSAASHAT